MAALTAGCSARPVQVPVPRASPDAARVCRALSSVLPPEVHGRERVATEPASPRTAAWGQPALVLRCGVNRPVGLTPDAEILEVNGVEWFLVESPEGFRFTTVGRKAYVELLVPASVDRTEATAPLVDLAEAMKRAVPMAAP